jgi:RNA polymerase sigma-70 factor (ECF subfamily)
MDAPPPAPDPSRDAHAAELARVRRALAGDPTAKAEIAAVLAKVPRLVGSLLRTASTFVARDDLDDVAQDCVALVWRKLPDFEGRARLSTWIYRVVSLELKNALRRVAKRRRTGPPATAQPRPEPGSRKDDPQQLLVPWMIEECLASLDPTPKEIVRLRHWEGRPFDEIAGLLGTNASQVKSLYYRALARLHDLLGEADGTGAER